MIEFFNNILHSDMYQALIIFVITYVLLLVLPKYRAYIALGSAIIFVLLQIIPFKSIFSEIDWNVIMMIAGTMGIVSLFIESKMPALLADLIIEKTPNVKWAIVSLALFAGIISAFIDNVATVLMVAPVALNIAKKLKISPVPIIISIAIASNLQGAATLVGDTTSILLGGELNLDFLNFFFFKGKPGLFFVVEAGALVATMILLFIFRKQKELITTSERATVQDYFPTILLLGTIVLLIVASFIPNKPAITNGLICLGLLFVGLVKELITKNSFKSIVSTIKDVDFFTLLLLASLFVVIGGLKIAGVVQAIGDIMFEISQGDLFLIYTIIVWASVLLSAFIDNIPYIATMLPVIGALAVNMGFAQMGTDAGMKYIVTDPKAYILYFGLLVGATLGGNLTPIGASANIAGLGILRKEGYEVKAGEFMKLGIPFTLAAVITGYILIWLIWY